MNAMEQNGTELNERKNECMNEGTKDEIAQHDIISIQCEHKWTFSFFRWHLSTNAILPCMKRVLATQFSSSCKILWKTLW